MLIKSLEKNIPDSQIWACLTENGITLEQLQKVWKKKALFYLGKAYLKKQNYSLAVESLEEALALIADDASLAANATELRDLIADAKARRNKEKQKEKDTWSKAFKKGQSEKESMYHDPNDKEPGARGGAVSSSPSSPSSPGKQQKAPGAAGKATQPLDLKVDLSDVRGVSGKNKNDSNSSAVQPWSPQSNWFSVIAGSLGVVALLGLTLFFEKWTARKSK
jgi:tetratricopeptide (TPR) repeat protein